MFLLGLLISSLFGKSNRCSNIRSSKNNTKTSLEVKDLPPGGVGLCSWCSPNKTEGQVFVHRFTDVNEIGLMDALVISPVIIEMLRIC